MVTMNALFHSRLCRLGFFASRHPVTETDHMDHISRHLSMLAQSPNNEENVEKILKICQFRKTQNGYEKIQGDGTADEGICAGYLKLVKSLFGETAYRFTKANFRLAGCNAEE